MRRFVYSAQAARVVFGTDSLASLPDELERLGVHRALILSTPEQATDAERVARALGAHAAGLFAQAAMHVPVEIARQARQVARELQADGTVAIGGGSTIGLGKAIALEPGLPILAIPTTYAGSEVTPIYGLTEGGLKRTGKDPRVLPRTVIYDPKLTLSLPSALSITSGMNAIAHSAEALYAQDGNPIMDLIAEEGISVLAAALPVIRREPRNLEAREQALYGAWLCGTALGNVGMALHHKLCHTLGGSFNLSHAEVHTVVLPHAIAYNAPAVPAALKRLGHALGSESPALALYELARSNGAPCSLRELGMAAADLDRAADLALENSYWNPRPLERTGIRTLLQHAWEGAPPI